VEGGGQVGHARLPAIRLENEDSFDTNPLPLIDFAPLLWMFSIPFAHCQKRHTKVNDSGHSTLPVNCIRTHLLIHRH